MHLLNFVSPCVLAYYTFAMECLFVFPAHIATTSLPNAEGFEIFTLQENITLFITSDRREKYGKFSPHYQIIPLYLPAIRKDLPIRITSIHITATTHDMTVTVETARQV